MIASVHLADVGPVGTARTLFRRRSLRSIPGLRWAEVTPLAPLALAGPPPVGRVGLLAFWDDEAAVDRFEATHPLAGELAGGFTARLEPLRAYGAWPGLPADLPTARSVPHDGPVVVLTLGYLRLSQAVRFLQTSRPAEKAAVEADGLLWGTAAARPPFVATVSIWESDRASAAYAWGRHQPHAGAIAEQRRKDFHRQSTFVRFAPRRVEGSLAGRNPLPAAVVPPT